MFISKHKFDFDQLYLKDNSNAKKIFEIQRKRLFIYKDFLICMKHFYKILRINFNDTQSEMMFQYHKISENILKLLTTYIIREKKHKLIVYRNTNNKKCAKILENERNSTPIVSMKSAN
ncbi:hypothetical protein BpHYR1_012144 [Brachionus plicatilis]|uniref:Uncharacterized protein n=1 Tax=Brachionus plicatilis TaxID=10195 RepID=A0A3M7R8B2_BRAPC|nr:hypothetical protein BpHYR1_012144 [Brachionus plicatilis]